MPQGLLNGCLYFDLGLMIIYSLCSEDWVPLGSDSEAVMSNLFYHF